METFKRYRLIELKFWNTGILEPLYSFEWASSCIICYRIAVIVINGIEETVGSLTIVCVELNWFRNDFVNVDNLVSISSYAADD